MYSKQVTPYSAFWLRDMVSQVCGSESIDYELVKIENHLVP